MADSDSIYSSLEESSIRLLEIVPALPDEQIECVLTTIHDIEDAPSFEALSYVWGESLSPDPILCNGIRVTVTQNLHEALKYLRPLPSWESVHTWSTKHELHSSRHVWRSFARNRYEQQENTMLLRIPVWIDAICINQDDLSERAQQVKMMRQIYQTASTVKIWLGKEQKLATATSVAEREARASLTLLAQAGTGPRVLAQRSPMMSQVRRLAPRHHLETYGSMPVVLSFLAQALRNMESRPNPLVSLRPLEDSEHRNLVYGLPPPSAKEWKAFREFLSNPWFQRIWVVQEVVLARKAVVVRGNWHMDWDAVGKATTWFEAKGYAMPRTMRYVIKDPKDLLPVTGASILWQMHSLLKDFRSRDSSQDVDRLYAALGLAQETEGSRLEGLHSLLEPDYSKPLQNVFRDLTIYLIIEHGSLDVLSYVDNSNTQSLALPSWVPDWRVTKASSEIWNAQKTFPFCADLNQPLSLSFGEDLNSLSLEGLKVDQVRFYGDKLISYGFGFETYSQELDFVQGAWNLAKGSSQSAEPTNSRTVRRRFRNFISTILTHDAKLGLDKIMDDASEWLSKHLPGQFPGVSSTKWFGTKRADPGRFHDAFVRVCTDKRFFITRDGRMGIGPETMKENDDIVIFFGAKVPFIIRRLGSRYMLIGECYVSGLMNGEPVERWKSAGGACDRFHIC
ncbi:heterokaryon incompatibility protein-domain-containing protein [Xylaria sp. FL0043]|nr:heterokaryon incompatibility protein-domain-containing protein [Xylaria sp. FL0043]